MIKYILIVFMPLMGCGYFKKNKEPKPTIDLSEDVINKIAVYRDLLKDQKDEFGLVRMNDSIGDSALFSCIAKASGAIDFDPMVLFVDGKPVRHPLISPGNSKTPISKDMVNGILWCAWDQGRKGDNEAALNITQALIAYGKANKDRVAGWYFCSEQDRIDYQISDENWLGRCLMTPSVVADIYKMHKWAGGECDDDCRYWLNVGISIVTNSTGFQRHLSVLTILRNGLIDGAISGAFLDVLKNAAESQPKNALYLAAYHFFKDGDQSRAYGELLDESLFPKDALPSNLNYCTDYLYQRDQDQKDWVPCGTEPHGSKGRGIEWSFAASIALGKFLNPTGSYLY